MRRRAGLILAAIMPLMTASPPAKSQGGLVPAPFVFTEDENLPDTDLLESISPTDALRQNASGAGWHPNLERWIKGWEVL